MQISQLLSSCPLNQQIETIQIACVDVLLNYVENFYCFQKYLFQQEDNFLNLMFEHVLFFSFIAGKIDLSFPYSLSLSLSISHSPTCNVCESGNYCYRTEKGSGGKIIRSRCRTVSIIVLNMREVKLM